MEKVILSAHRNPSYHYSPIAQLAEHGAVNTGVVRSSRTGGVGSDPAITSRALLPTKTQNFSRLGGWPPLFCPCSSVVEQRFCKPLVAGSNPVGGLT